MRLLSSCSLVLLSQLSQAAAQTASPFEMRPPIAVEESRAYGDGGTLALLLSGADGRRLWVVASGDGWEDQIPPDGTLFLDAGHHRSPGARLPRNAAEYDRVEKLLRMAAEKEELPGEAEADPDSDEAWEFSMVGSVLGKLTKSENREHYDPGHSEPPAWYAEYDAKRLNRERRGRLEDQRDARFLACYPVVVRSLLNIPNIDWAFDLSGKEETILGDRPEKTVIAARARLLAAGVGDPAWLAEINCKAFGVLGGRPRGWSFGELVAEASMRSVTPEAFLAALERIEGDRVALLGASAFFFEPYLLDEFTEDDLKRWLPTVVEVVLAEGAHHNQQAMIKRVEALDYPWASALLRGNATGASATPAVAP